MSGREKMLALVAGLAAVGFLGYLIADRVVLSRAADLERQAEALLGEIGELEALVARQPVYEKRLARYAGRTFGSDEARATEEVREYLLRLLRRSGLDPTRDFALNPFRRRVEKGVLAEIGCGITIAGPLERIVDFLYLLKEDPYLHRLENLSLARDTRSGRVKLTVHYLTLALKGEKAAALPAATVGEGALETSLDGEGRRRYDLITSRDLFRPYVPRPPEPVRTARAVPSPPSAPPAPPPPPPGPEARYRVVGLPAVNGDPRIIVSDTATGQSRTYGVGDELAGGLIVMVDYRPMPMPDRPEFLSSSRAVLRFGSDYWAVELGALLTERHRLGERDLPPRLAGPRPAGGTGLEETESLVTDGEPVTDESESEP
jgi:hypothetical protein